LNISTNGIQGTKQATISVLSASGIAIKTIQLNSLNRVVQVDVSSLVSGVYTVKVVSGGTIIFRQCVKL
jgi:hypothetical protein